MKKLEALRAARALFDVALAQHDPDRVAADLEEVVRLLDGHGELERTLTNPMVPTAAKRAIVAQLAPRLGLAAAVEQLLLLLAERDRVSALRPVAKAFHARLLDHRRVSEAEVTTAVPLAGEQAAAIAQGLSEATGRHVSLVQRVDPAILGGVVARVGSLVFDGSLTTQLREARVRLASEGVTG